MQSQRVPVVAVALLLASSCGDGGDSRPVADPTTPSSTSTTSEPVVPDTTSAPPVVTTLEPPPSDDVTVLRPDGLGPIDFGTPAEEAIAELTDVLDAPDRVEPIGPGGECVEGAGWLECVRALRIIDGGQLAVWDNYGLEVALVDTHRDVWPQEQTPLQFGDWHATVAPGDARLVTDGGISPGMPVGELRTAAPGVEFTYNEGLLDSYSVTFGASGGYWGRLDWDPATTDIEWHDVAAIQAALNRQGEDLVVDGVWGPTSKAAWLAFLSDHGIHRPALGADWPLWLTPDIGRALGLPPDDVSVASLEPRPATQTDPAALPVLRADGLGRYDFGEPANELVDELTTMFGSPSEDISHTPDGPGPFDYLPLGYWAAHELRMAVWEEPDLRLVLGDVPWLGDRFGDATPGTLSLVSWDTSSPRFVVDDHLAVGSALADLRAHVPEVVFGTFDVCETEYDPAGYVAMPYGGDNPPLGRGLRGTTDWDWVSDLQTALNTRGAALAVDGEYGPSTKAAVADLQRELGVDHADGNIDPNVADALGLHAPDDAHITGLEAGYPGSC